jgi:hypothetical protein
LWLTPLVPATWEVEIGRITVGGQLPGKRLVRLSQRTSQIWWSMSVIPDTWGVEVGGLWSKTSYEKKKSMRPYLKNSYSKKAGVVA